MKTGIYIVSALLASFLYAIVLSMSALIVGDQVGDHDGVVAIIIFWVVIIFYMILSVPLAVIMTRKNIKGRWAIASAVVCVVITPVSMYYLVETMLFSPSFVIFLLLVLFVLSFASFYYLIVQSLFQVYGFFSKA